MISIFRGVVLVLFAFAGYFLGTQYGFDYYGIILGVLCGVITVFSDLILRKVNVGTIIGGIVGLAAGVLFAELFLVPLRLLMP